MIGSKVKLDKDLLRRIEKYSRIAGYSSPAEFILTTVFAFALAKPLGVKI